MRDAAIFDLDGTLCDTSGVVHLLEGESADFAVFQAAAVQCPPSQDLVRTVQEVAATGRAVLIVTSREYIWHDHTVEWLGEHQIPYDALYMRIVGDYRKDVEVKADLYESLCSDGYSPTEAWDDKPGVVQMWRERGLSVHLVGESPG